MKNTLNYLKYYLGFYLAISFINWDILCILKLPTLNFTDRLFILLCIIGLSIMAYIDNKIK